MSTMDRLAQVALTARRSLCLRSRCGALIVAGNDVIGKGYNAPPRDDLSHRMCNAVAASKTKPKSDRTCCVHAEWRAITAALATAAARVEGSTLYFARVDPETGLLAPSGRPYCTACSRLALDVGIGHWVLWHGPVEGVRIYEAGEYNRLSHLYDDLTRGVGTEGG
jgi:deoxycytidylate deaminase